MNTDKLGKSALYFPTGGTMSASRNVNGFEWSGRPTVGRIVLALVLVALVHGCGNGDGSSASQVTAEPTEGNGTVAEEQRSYGTLRVDEDAYTVDRVVVCHERDSLDGPGWISGRVSVSVGHDPMRGSDRHLLFYTDENRQGRKTQHVVYREPRGNNTGHIGERDDGYPWFTIENDRATGTVTVPIDEVEYELVLDIELPPESEYEDC
jgi:hypothetical protein